MGWFRNDRLLEARVGLELSQEEAAAAVGVDVRTYRRYESGAVNHPRSGFSIRHPSRRRLVDKMAAELGIEPGELVQDSRAPAPAPPVSSAGPHRLPPARSFVGRTEILARLVAWIREREPGVKALVAVGGAGKTALAEQVVRSRSDAFVWSFYLDEQTEAMLEAALAHVGAAAPSGARSEQIEAALRERGGLLLFDGLEMVQADGQGTHARGQIEDPALRRLLRAAAAGLGRTQVLITTRFTPVDLAPWTGRGFEAIELAELTPSESESLLAALGVDQPRALAQQVGGHALSLAVAGGYVRGFLDGDAHRLVELDLDEASQEDPLARRLAAMVDAYARVLAPLERDVLLRLAVFPRGAGAEVFATIGRAGGDVAGALAGADTAAIERALARLRSLGIASRAGRVHALHPFVAQIARRRLGEAEPAVHRIEASRLSSLLAGLPSETVSDPVVRERLEALLFHLLGAGQPVEAFEVYQRALGGFASLGLELGEMNRGARIARALDAAAGLPRLLAQTVRYDVGLYAGALGDLGRALAAYATYVDDSRERGDLAALTTGLRTTAYMERLAGSLTGALRAIERAHEVAIELGDSLHLARTLSLRASIHHDRGEAGEARRLFDEAGQHGVAPVARRGLWEAEHLVDLGDLARARSLTENNLAFCRANGWPGHAAHCHAVLGSIAAREGDERAAREHLAAVDAWTDLSGEVEMVLRAGELRGALPGGERAAEEGAAKAERLGFALFQVRLLRLANRRADADRRAAELGYAW